MARVAWPLRVAGVLAFVAGVGFGLPAALGLLRSSSLADYLFLAVCVAEVVAAGLLWRGRNAGVWASLAILPFELWSWMTLGLPWGLLLGVVRTILVVAGRPWSSAPERSPEP